MGILTQNSKNQTLEDLEKINVQNTAQH